MTTIILNTAKETWDSFFGRVILLGLAFGWVPFFLLCKVQAALTA